MTPGTIPYWDASIGTPRVLNTGKPPLLLRVPYAEDNREWLRGEELRKPTWNRAAKRWEVPLSWKPRVLRLLIERYAAVILIQRTPKSVEKCAPACWRAESDVTECICSCGGANHGTADNPGGFHEINETLAVRVHDDGGYTPMLMTRRVQPHDA